MRHIGSQIKADDCVFDVVKEIRKESVNLVINGQLSK